VGRRHPGVATVLVDLVARRLEQHERLPDALRVAQSDFDDDRMRRADRGHAGGVPLLVAGDEVEQDLHVYGIRSGRGAGSRSGSSTSSSEAIRARTRPTIFSGPGTTLAKT